MPHAIFFPILFILQTLWFVAPGLLMASFLCKRKYFKSIYAVLVAALTSCVLAYISFWVYTFSVSLGQLFSCVTVIASVGSLVLLGRIKWVRRFLFSIEVIVPLALWFSSAFLYSSLLFGCRTVQVPIYTNQLCYTSNVTFDNILPELFAHNIYSNNPKALMGDWHGSDRPPLQTGAILMEAPLTQSVSAADMSYLILAVFLQMIWVPGVWLLGRKIGLTGHRLALLLVLCLSSGFFFFNSMFAWPKLLAGGIGVLALSLLLLEKPTKMKWLIGSIALSLALLSHGGVAFTILPMGLLFLTKRYYPGWKNILILLLVIFGLYAPWSIYQHAYDPPGDRVLKWEIAGSPPVDSRSFAQTLEDSYRAVGVEGTIHNKAVNAQTVVYAPDSMNHLYTHDILGNIRDIEFRFVFFGLGLMNLGWLVLLHPKMRKKLRSSQLDQHHLKTLLLLSGASLAVWVLIMFGPGSTIIHGGSYLTMIMLFTILGVLVQFLQRKILNALVVIKIVYFSFVWIVSVYLYNHISITYGIMAIFSVGTTGYILFKTSKRKPALYE